MKKVNLLDVIYIDNLKIYDNELYSIFITTLQRQNGVIYIRFKPKKKNFKCEILNFIGG